MVAVVVDGTVVGAGVTVAVVLATDTVAAGVVAAGWVVVATTDAGLLSVTVTLLAVVWTDVAAGVEPAAAALRAATAGVACAALVAAGVTAPDVGTTMGAVRTLSESLTLVAVNDPSAPRSSETTESTLVPEAGVTPGATDTGTWPFSSTPPGAARTID